VNEVRNMVDVALPLVRRPLRFDEWDESHFVEIARDHGIRRPGRRDVDRIRAPRPSIQLSSAVDGSKSMRSTSTSSGYPHYAGSHAPPWAAYSKTTPIRYCPYCFLEARYLRMRWRLSGYHACGIHGCFLKRNLKLTSLSKAEEQRGLCRMDAVSDEQILEDIHLCSAEELAVHRSIWGEMERHLCEEPVDSSKVLHAELVAWAILTWALVEHVVKIFHARLTHLPYVGPLKSVSDFLHQRAVQVASSTDGVVEFFRGITEYQAFSGGLRRLAQITSAEKQIPSIFSKINLEPLLQRVSCMRPEFLTRPQAGSNCFSSADGRGMSIKEFSKLIGISAGTASVWVRKRTLKSEERVQSTTSGLRFVPHHLLKDFLRSRQRLITRDEFSKYHELDEAAVNLLYSSGLVQTVEYGWCRFVTITSVSSLMLKLELHSTPVQQGQGDALFGLFSSDVSSSALNYSEHVALVKAAVTGDVPLFRSLDTPGLSSFSINAEGLLWMRRRRQRQSTKNLPSRLGAMDLCMSLF